MAVVLDHRHVGLAGDKPTMFDHTEWQRKRRRENPERDREYSRQYYRRHKDDPSWRERRRAYLKRYCQIHKEKRHANARKWHQARKAEAIEHYGKVCACCGESTYEFLCIDHINGGGNRQREQLGCSRNFLTTGGLWPSPGVNSTVPNFVPRTNPDGVVLASTEHAEASQTPS